MQRQKQAISHPLALDDIETASDVHRDLLLRGIAPKPTLCSRADGAGIVIGIIESVLTYLLDNQCNAAVRARIAPEP